MSCSRASALPARRPLPSAPRRVRSYCMFADERPFFDGTTYKLRCRNLRVRAGHSSSELASILSRSAVAPDGNRPLLSD
jgi:hypothetical protein